MVGCVAQTARLSQFAAFVERGVEPGERLSRHTMDSRKDAVVRYERQESPSS